MPASGEIDRSIDTEWEAESRSIPENNLLFHDSGYTTTVIDTEKWSGSLTPRFYARMRAGELLPHTSWRHLTQQGEVTAGSWGSHNKIGNAHYYYLKKPRNKHDPRPSEGELDGVINSSSINPHSLVQAAAAGIYSSGHDTFTFIAELHKVYDLVRNGLESIINLCTGRTPAQSWLEYRYGWRILYYDYVELSKILQELGEKERKRYSNRVGSSDSGSSTSIETFSLTSGTYDLVTEDTWTLSVRGMVTADISPATFQFNPAITAWELITYSFIIDWFVNIGRWIAAISFIAIQSNYTASYGYMLTHTRNLTSQNHQDSSTHYEDFEVYRASCVSILKTRTPTTVSLHPFAGVNLDFSKILDLIAILASLIANGGKRKRGTGVKL